MATDWTQAPKTTLHLADKTRLKLEKLKNIRKENNSPRAFNRYIVGDAIDLLYEKEIGS
jgi:hypothetical protein